MNYATYTSQDFILDDYFKRWVLDPDPQADIFWQNWLKEHPEKAHTVEEAREFILRMKFTNYQPSYQEFEADWNKLNKKIEDYEQAKLVSTQGKKTPNSSVREPEAVRYIWPYWKAVAASILLVVAIAALYLSNIRNTTTTISTPYGEIKTVVLPDESVVTLNANSTLIYKTDLNTAGSREVWLEGEAFFEIKRKSNSQNFLVHTRDLIVEVLGTKFNVNERRKQTQVVLNEGLVKLNINKSTSDTALIMQVGELVEFSGNKKNLRKQLVNPDTYSAWKNKEWILDNLSLQEVAIKIEETYGVKVEIKNARIAKETVTGVVPTGNLDTLLRALSTVFKINITYKNNLITIQP